MSDDRPPPQGSDEPPEIVRADPQQARRLRLAVFSSLAFAFLVWLLFRYWQRHANAYDVLHRMYGLAYLIGIGLLAVAWYAWRYAQRILRSAQYPPPGGWVWGATLVLRGDAARARALQMVFCAALLALLGLYSLYLPYSIRTTIMPGTQPILIDPNSSPASPKTIAHPPRVPAAFPASRPHG
ncbi:MAG: hypothetical protein JSR34_01990 [Proteobacteria bacterium]|nr:hypothetical protein [Pseudomonadota bacterium]